MTTIHRPTLSFNFNNDKNTSTSSFHPSKSPSKTHRISIKTSTKNSSQHAQGSESARVQPKSSSLKRTPFDYSAVGTVPIVIKDQQYIKRKETFDTFLRVRDLELLLGVNHKHEDKNTIIDRNTSIDQVGVLHNKLKNELRAKLKNREGKMFSNELWSIDYYTSIIQKSSLKKKFDHISNLRFKPLGKKVQEVEDLFNRRMEKNRQLEEGENLIRRYRNSVVNSEYNQRDSISPAKIGEDNEEDEEDGGESVPTSATSIEKKPSLLKTYFQNLEVGTPEIKIQDTVSAKTIPTSTLFTDRSMAKNQLTLTESDVLYTAPISARINTEPRHFRIKSTLQNLHEDIEFENPLTSAGHTPTASPKNQLTKAKFSSPSLSATHSAFVLRHKKKNSLLNSPSGSFTRDRPDSKASTKASYSHAGVSLFKKSSEKSTSSGKFPTIAHILDTEANQKVESLIHQCTDLKQQHKELVKDIKEKKQCLAASPCRRKLHQKLEKIKEKDMLYTLDQQIKLLKNSK